MGNIELVTNARLLKLELGAPEIGGLAEGDSFHCAQVRRRSTRDGLDAVSRGLLTYQFERLQLKIDLTVLIDNSVPRSDGCLLPKYRIYGAYRMSLEPNKGVAA